MKAQFTKLYKTNRQYIAVDRRKEFVHNLQIAIDAHKTKPFQYGLGDSTNLGEFMVWDETPQGHLYWLFWEISIERAKKKQEPTSSFLIEN